MGVLCDCVKSYLFKSNTTEIVRIGIMKVGPKYDGCSFEVVIDKYRIYPCFYKR